MMIRCLSCRQSREVDRVAIEKLGFSGLVLMENAGRGAVDMLERYKIVRKNEPIGVVCGKGNNGGDGFVMSRHLIIRGFIPRVILLATPGDLVGDAKTNFDLLRKSCDVDIYSFQKITKANRPELSDLLQCPVLIDALLGTGASGQPREPFAETIRLINQTREKTSATVVALDIPSGLDADTGQPDDPTVVADLTLTMYSEKIGFRRPEAASFLGSVHVLDIGVVPNLEVGCP